jgi:hypothetical protein
MSSFPSRLLFKPIVSCPRFRRAPLVDGDLSEWADVPPLPPLGEYDGENAFAEVYVAWDETGLYVAERCRKPAGTVAVNRRRPEAGDGLQVWIDARATQTAHRATRFCHQFILLPRSGGGGHSAPVGWQVNIRRARERPPLCRPEQIGVAASVHPGHYILEAHLPAAILMGFEPRAGVLLGFNYLVHDVPGGRRVWAAPSDFAFDRDPSLWGLLELTE